MAIHSSIPAWEIPWTEEPGGLQSWGHKEPYNTEWLSTHTHTHTPVVYICQKLKSKRFSKLVKQLPVSLFPYALVTAILLLLLSLASWPGSPTQCAVHASCYRLWWSKRRGKVAQSCPALYDPMDCSPPGSSVHGISQASIPDWVAITPGDLPDPGIKPSSLALQADSLPPEPVK